MEKVYKEIGLRFRALRKARKMTQAQVAEKAGIDSSFYGQIERGANVPSLKTLFSLAAVFRVEPAQLIPSNEEGAREPALRALDPLLARLKPAKRRFLLSVVTDLADELER